MSFYVFVVRPSTPGFMDVCFGLDTRYSIISGQGASVHHEADAAH